MCQRLNANARAITQFPDQTVPLHFWAKLAADINNTAAAGDDRCIVARLFKALVAYGSDAGFAKVVPSCPHKVADHIWEALDHLPVVKQAFRQCLRSDDHSFRVDRRFFFIAGSCVVVSADVKGGDRRLSSLIGCGLGCHSFDQPAQLVHPEIEELAGRQVVHALAAVFVLLAVFLLSVDAPAFGSHAAEHEIDAKRYRTGGIEGPTIVC